METDRPGSEDQIDEGARPRREARCRCRREVGGRGLSNAAVAAKLRTTGFTVGFWRNRFIAGSVAGLGDEPRPGAPRQIGDDKIEQAVRLTLEKTPKGATH